MINKGYIEGNTDHILFDKKKNKMASILLVYIGNMIITGDDEKIEKLKGNLLLNLISNFLAV